MAVANAKRAKILAGRPVADQIKQEVAAEVQRLQDDHGIKPTLAAVLVGEDDASAVYVKNKIRACAEVGLGSEQFNLPATTTTNELLKLLGDLNQNDAIDGILVQLPLPKQIDEAAIIEAMARKKT